MMRHWGIGDRRRELRVLAASAAEVIIAVAAASLLVAALNGDAPAAGLGIVYLPGVLALAIRRSQAAALSAAVLSVLCLNYFFIVPRHRLSIAHSQDFAELCVFLFAAIVVGRLAAAARRESAEAERRAREAASREREATLIARSASAILAGQGVQAQLESIARAVASATGASSVRIGMELVPTPKGPELALPLPVRAERAWLYITPDAYWDRQQLERVVEPLGKLLDVAIERERMAERTAEAEATRRADVARTAILHAISHDLRSPLTAITTAASALRSSAVTDAEREELVDVIEADGTRLARLVGDLLDLSRIEAGAVMPRADWCDLHEIVSSAAAQVGAERRIKFTVPPELPLVRADAAQLERVFSNLIDNALKFSPPDTPVEIGGGFGPRWVTIRVTDHGAGVPKAQRKRVFEPFYRGADQRTGGSGLGLAICRGFVEANGGRIALHAAPDRGASFTVSFPYVRQPAPVP
jgi:two-component system, OmpR family, sensor histidine kinase KdpD